MHLTCAAEFSMTCTSGILVDIFQRLESCQKKRGKGTVKQERLFSVYCAFKTFVAGGREKLPTVLASQLAAATTDSP